MNRYAILLLAIGLLTVPAFAQESADADGNMTEAPGAGDAAAAEAAGSFEEDANVTVNETEVGAVPGDWNYGFKRFFENFDKFFTFDKAESARKHAEYGLMRAKEAHVLSGRAQRLAAEGRDAEADATLAEVEKLAEEQNAELEDAQESLEAALEDGSANETQAEQVRNRTRNSIIVLQRVYEKAPEAAKDGLLRALNNSIGNYERHIERVQAKEQEKEQKGNRTGAAEGGNGTGNGAEAGPGNGNGNKTKAKVKNEGEESQVEEQTEAGEQLGDLNQTREQTRNETQGGKGKGGQAQGGDDGAEEEEPEDEG